MYPAFVNCTTIDWFSEWPEDALLEVADKYLENMEFANEEEVRVLLIPFFFYVFLKSYTATLSINFFTLRLFQSFRINSLFSLNYLDNCFSYICSYISTIIIISEKKYCTIFKLLSICLNIEQYFFTC